LLSPLPGPIVPNHFGNTRLDAVFLI